jgi:peptidoglycan/LPS O-acetylase OafA/YrhL
MKTRGINFGNLDALRGLLAVYVLVGHARWLLWRGHAAWLASAHQWWEFVPVYGSALFRFGREAVLVFFVLSGFFIHYRAARADGRGDDRPSDFLRRRWHRIAPPYFFALAITAVCDAIGRSLWPVLYAAQTGDALLDQTLAHGGYRLESIVPALFVLPSSLGFDFGSNGPIWSLAFEAVYYAVYPLWLRLRRRSSTLAFIVIPAICLSIAFMPIGPFLTTVVLFYPTWLVGAYLAERLVTTGVPQRAVAIGGALFAGGALTYLARPPALLSTMAAIVFGAGMVLVFAGSRVRTDVVSTSLEFLGIRSYTIYVVHFPFLVLLSAYLFQTYGERPTHGWIVVPGAVLAVAVGVVCFEVCERHFLHSKFGHFGERR